MTNESMLPVLDRNDSRRDFLRTAGGVSAAVAGAGLLAACGGDDAPPAPEAGSIEARLRRGLVSISGDETPQYPLNWNAPRPDVDAPLPEFDDYRSDTG